MKKIVKIVEELDTIGQDSEDKAAKAVIEVERGKEKAEQKKDFDTLNKLDFSKRQNFTYKDILIKAAKYKILDIGIPKGFYFDVGPSKKGIIFGFRHYTTKKWYMKGMLVTYLPDKDLFGISIMINWALDQMELWMNQHKTKKS